MRAGNLNGLPGGPAVDPSTGLPFLNNQIPAGEISSVSSKLCLRFTLANFNSGSTFANYRTFIPTPITTNGYDLRVDHYFSPTQQVFGR